MWAKIITIKRTKDLNYFSLCAFIYLIHKFYNLSWITEINKLFHDILLYWDAPVDAIFCIIKHYKMVGYNLGIAMLFNFIYIEL